MLPGRVEGASGARNTFFIHPHSRDRTEVLSVQVRAAECLLPRFRLTREWVRLVAGGPDSLGVLRDSSTLDRKLQPSKLSYLVGVPVCLLALKDAGLDICLHVLRLGNILLPSCLYVCPIAGKRLACGLWK